MESSTQKSEQINTIKNEESHSKCEVCQKLSNKFCSGCRKSVYCSQKCQKNHWKTHKTDCFPARIFSDEKYSRYFVSTKNLKPGDLIFADHEIMSGPSGAETIFHKICLGCYRVVQGDLKCSNCSWFICSPNCQNSGLHSEFECKILKDNKIPMLTMPHEYQLINILRTLLLREKCPLKWGEVLQMESHVEERLKSRGAALESKIAFEFIFEKCNLKEFSFDEVHHTVGVWGVNAYGNGNNSPVGDNFSTETRLATFLFPKLAIASHSCIANTRGVLLQITPKDKENKKKASKIMPENNDKNDQKAQNQNVQKKLEFRMELYASLPIKEGEQIFTTYADVSEGTFERRKTLKEFYYFDCNCSRCSDPKENFSYFSSFKCQDCKKGYLIFENALNFDPLLICENRNCPSCSNDENRTNYASFSNEKLNKVKLAMNQICSDSESTPLKNIDRLEGLLKENSKKILHPNHWLLVEIEFRIAQRLVALVSNAKRHGLKTAELKKRVSRLIELCLHCLQVAGLVRPGHNNYRGKLLYCLTQGRFQELILQGNSTDILSQVAQLDVLKTGASEALEILSIEPEGSEEKKTYKWLLEDMKEIQIFQNLLNSQIKMKKF